MKRHDSCATCGFLDFGSKYNGWNSWIYTHYCKINDEKIKYPRKMGGRDKCPCYMDKAEYRKENKRKTIENHIYPQKPEIKKEVEE